VPGTAAAAEPIAPAAATGASAAAAPAAAELPPDDGGGGAEATAAAGAAAATPPVSAAEAWFATNATPQDRARYSAAAARHPERVAEAAGTDGFDDGLSDDGDDDRRAAEEGIYAEFGAIFKLRNAVSLHGGRTRAITSAISKFAAPFAAQILVTRGFVVTRGDAEPMMAWLDQPPGALPSESLWVSMRDVDDE
jgi:hypothetical protein